MVVSSPILRKFFIPSFHEITSSLFLAFCIDSIGRECLTLSNFSEGSAPIFRDGEFGKTREGNFFSRSSIDLLNSSYSLSKIFGL